MFPSVGYAISCFQHWLALERESGDAASIQRVFRMLPKKIKKKRIIKHANSVDEVQEVISYVFPDDEGSAAVSGKGVRSVQ